MTKYLVYDVFTDAPFGGNPLAVIPDATGLAEPLLQKIAREFNFSETTFVYPPQSSENTAKVRIFTPTTEVPFAGHPTIGTAIALRDEGAAGDLTLELGIGPVPCELSADGAAFTVNTPLETLAEPDPALIARAVGLDTDDIRTSVHPPLQISIGLPFTITELTSRDALSRCETDIAAFREGHARYPSGLDFAQFVYVRNGNAIDARMFAPLDNIPEDPATGSACATLAALLYNLEGRDQTLDITQGEDMGRLSKIKATASEEGITIAGQAVRTMEGRLTL